MRETAISGMCFTDCFCRQLRALQFQMGVCFASLTNNSGDSDRIESLLSTVRCDRSCDSVLRECRHIGFERTLILRGEKMSGGALRAATDERLRREMAANHGSAIPIVPLSQELAMRFYRPSPPRWCARARSLRTPVQQGRAVQW